MGPTNGPRERERENGLVYADECAVFEAADRIDGHRLTFDAALCDIATHGGFCIMTTGSLRSQLAIVQLEDGRP